LTNKILPRCKIVVLNSSTSFFVVHQINEFRRNSFLKQL